MQKGKFIDSRVASWTTYGRNAGIQKGTYFPLFAGERNSDKGKNDLKETREERLESPLFRSGPFYIIVSTQNEIRYLAHVFSLFFRPVRFEGTIKRKQTRVPFFMTFCLLSIAVQNF